MDSSEDSLSASVHDSLAGSTSSTASAASDVRPQPLDLSHLYSVKTKMRLPSMIKDHYKYFQIPGIGNLAGGLPNAQFFPYDTLEAQIAKPERWTPSPNKHDDDGGAAVRLVVDDTAASTPSNRWDSEHLVVPKTSPTPAPDAPTPKPDSKIDLATALQYGTAEGYPPLLAWVRQFSCGYLHAGIPYAGGPDVTLTVGSTDGLTKALDLFADDWNPTRDPVATRPGFLCETFAFGNALNQATPKGMQIVPVRTDSGGMLAHGPDSLEDILAHWDPTRGRRPHILYTVTMGHNPTGIVLSVARRKQLYAVCSRFDVIIIEDDPYWYLQFPSAAANEAASRDWPTSRASIAELAADDGNDHAAMHRKTSTGYPFLDSLVPSFLRFDVDGRVVRLDTFSKTIAPGCRLGWITAQPAFIERLVHISETSTQQPSGFVQALVSELVRGPLPVAADQSTTALTPMSMFSLSSWRSTSTKTTPSSLPPSAGSSTSAFSGWQMDGWVRWLEGLRGAYEQRMNRMCTILDRGAFQVKQGTPVRPADADWIVITKTQLYSFDWPRGGMFIWVRIHYETHPLWQAPHTDPAAGVLDGPTFCFALMLFLTTKPYLVLFSPGTMFSATDVIRATRGWAYIRLCFAAESDDNLVRCSERLVSGIHAFWKLKRVQDIEALLHDASATLATARATGKLSGASLWQHC